MLDTEPGTVGFIGLGTMGAPMCARLAERGHPVLVHDADAEHVRAVLAHGIAAARPAELGARSAVVITMLPDGPCVREALLGRPEGSEGAASTMAPGTAVVDMSSSAPLGTQQLGSRLLAHHGVRMVDAPVSGNPAAARAGRLNIMAGGGDDVLAQVLPVLASLGTVTHVGELGSGHAVKALNNLLSAIGLATAAEALLVARRFGLNPAVVLDVVNGSTGRNHATENKVGQHVLSRSFDSGFSLRLMRKDVATAVELAQASGAPTRFADACRDLWDSAYESLGPDADNTEVVRWMELEADALLGPAVRHRENSTLTASTQKG